MQIANLSYSGDELTPRPILEDISFSIGQRDIFGIIGASGAGKTTLGQLIAGLIKPTCGEIKTGPPPDPQMGMVFQNPEEQFFEEKLIRVEDGYGNKNEGQTQDITAACAMNPAAAVCAEGSLLQMAVDLHTIAVPFQL